MAKELQDIYRLQAFVTVVEEGSLSAAVSRLHVTQPALSTRIRLLEESLNCPLLERTGRGVRPTQMGELVYKIAVDVLHRMEDLHETVRSQFDLREGYVHLCGGSTAITGIFPDMVSQFSQDHKGIFFTIKELDPLRAIMAVQDGVCDVAIVCVDHISHGHEEVLSRLHVHGMIEDELVLVASSEHVLSKAYNELHLSQKQLLPFHLNGESFLMPEEDSPVRKIIEREFRRLGVKVQTVMELRSVQGMFQMVARGLGITVVGKLSLCPWSEVQEIHVEGMDLTRKHLIVSSGERILRPAAQEFVNRLCAFKVPLKCTASCEKCRKALS